MKLFERIQIFPLNKCLSLIIWQVILHSKVSMHQRRTLLKTWRWCGSDSTHATTSSRTPVALNMSLQVKKSRCLWNVTDASTCACTHGESHCLIGEIKGGKVSGFHNWIQFYCLEKKGELNYYSHSFNGAVRVHITDILLYTVKRSLNILFCLSLSGRLTLMSWGCSSNGTGTSSRSALRWSAAVLNLILPSTVSVISLALENSEWIWCHVFWLIQ